MSIGPGGGDPLIHFHMCVFVCFSTMYVASSIGKKNRDTVTQVPSTYVLGGKDASACPRRCANTIIPPEGLCELIRPKQLFSFSFVCLRIPAFSEEVEDGRGATWKSGGCVFSGCVFPEARPLCFQEVDAGMKDRRENTLFWGLSTE